MIRFSILLIFTLSEFYLSAQEKVILHGVIMDEESQESLIGVHIFTSLTNGTTSDIDGNFYLSVEHRDTLHFSMLGYESKFLQIHDSIETQETIILLKPTAIVLESVGVTDYFQANTIVKTPERKVYKVPGIKYPENPEGESYRLGVGGAIFSPATAVYRLISKDYKEEKKAHEVREKMEQDEVMVDRVKEKIKTALTLNEAELDQYYYIDFIHFLGLDLQKVDHMYVYDLCEISRGRVQEYLKTLNPEKE